MASSVASTASRWALAISAGLLAGCLALLSACAPSRPDAGPGSELPFYTTPDFTAQWLEAGAAASEGLHRIGPFSFTDQDRQVITHESLRGRIYVANFFFTYCPSICPKMTATFKRIQDAFAADARVALVSHTVDPEHDTPDRLAEYAQQHGIQRGKWHLLTGDQSATYELARTSYFAEKQLGMNKTTNEFLHTENMLLIDQAGHIRGVYNATLPAEATRVIEDIRLLMSEP